MSKVTSRIRAAVGALAILAFASPLAAQTHHRGAQMRYAAQWVQRNHGAFRYAAAYRVPRWRAARFGWGYRAVAPRWGVGAWYAPPRYGWRRAYVRPVYRPLRRPRPWRRAWISGRYRVG